MKTLFDIVELLEKRPGMIVLNSSIENANSFIRGFLFAKVQNKSASKEEIKFHNKFNEWVQKKYRSPLNRSWSEIILFYEGENQPALEKFVNLFYEFFEYKEKETPTE